MGRMKRRQMILAVDLAMADNGYSRAAYGWSRATLQVWDRAGVLKHSLHLPTKTPLKQLEKLLSTLPVAGPPRAIHNYTAGAKDDGYRQTHINDFLGGRPS